MKVLSVLASIALCALYLLSTTLAETTTTPTTTSTTEKSATYFGVDANDKEAVREKQREMSHENFKKIFGDEVDPDDLDFSDLGQEESKGKVHERLRDALKWVFNKVLGKDRSSR